MKSPSLVVPLFLATFASATEAQVTVCKTCPIGSADYVSINDALNMEPSGTVIQVIDPAGTVYNENLDFMLDDHVLEAINSPIVLQPVSLVMPTVSMTGGQSRATVMRGFRVENNPQGAFLIFNGAPTLESLEIRNNGTTMLSGASGGITSISSAPLIDSCLIVTNRTGETGGGILVTGSSSGHGGDIPTVIDSDIFGNTAEFRGGGIGIDGADAMLIEGNRFFSGDSSELYPTHCDYLGVPGGGAVSVTSTGASPISIVNNEFNGNHSFGFGGAILCVGSSPLITTDDGSVMNGNAAECDGGAIAAMYGSAPLLTEYELSLNSTTEGGGAVTTQFTSDMRIERCIIRDSIAQGAGVFGGLPVARGGGVLVIGSSPEILETTLLRNKAGDLPGKPAQGGGIAVISESNMVTSPEIRDCTIEQNHARDLGGGVYVEGGPGGSGGLTLIENSVIRENGRDPFFTLVNTAQGGGVSLSSSNVTLLANNILHNSAATAGGGVHASGLPASALLANNFIVRNEIEDESGTLLVGSGAGLWFTGSVDRLIHNTIARNEAASGSTGAGVFVGSATQLWNSIVWNNAGGNDIDGNPVVQFCDVSTPLGWVSGAGNLSVVPVFVSPATDDFHLKFTSPVINQGNHLISGLTPFDFDGEARVLNGRTEMGADEVLVPTGIPPQ